MKNRNLFKRKSSRRIWSICGLSFMLFGISLPSNAADDISEQSSFIQEATQQSRKISGTIKDSAGDALIGATVQVKGTKVGTATDINGNFTLDASKGATLVVSYMGYKSQELKVGSQQNYSVILASDDQMLDELVVVGYGVSKKSDLTGAISTVKSEKLVAKGTTSAMEGLQGLVPGVNVTQSSSRAGDGFNFQIRGKSSLNSATGPLFVVDGIVCDNISFLNPMDIEQIDVLKDASSTAIYGSRATNGVVIVTTKKGSSTVMKATVSYDGYFGVKTKANMPDFMTGDEFMKWRFFRYVTPVNDNLNSWEITDANFKHVWGGDSPVTKERYRNGTYTDWADEVTRDGSQQNHFINITGNAKDMSYRIGLGYQKESGVMYDDYERWNIKGAVDHKISENVSAGFMANLSTSKKNNAGKNAVLNGFRMAPILPAYYTEGDKVGELVPQPGKDEYTFPNGGGPTSVVNPILDRMNTKDETRYYDAMANLYLQYSPIKEVILKTTFSPMYTKGHTGKFFNKNSQERYQKENLAENWNNDWFSYTWDTQANYIKTFGDHTLNALALVSVYEKTGQGDYMNVTGMPFDVDWYNLNAGTVENKSSYYDKVSMLSYVARVNYGYKGKYLLTVSSRWDGSSKFQKSNRWGMFPSAAAAWRVSEESFMESTKDCLSNLKLRLSYGLTGNNAGVGSYDTQALTNIQTYYNFGSMAANGYAYSLANAAMSWEKTSELNFGIDFGFFNNRINGAVDVYTKTSKDLLMRMDTPFEMGSLTGGLMTNIGKVNNKGIEILLNTLNINTQDLRWETSFTFARNINTIKELNGKKEDLVGNNWFIGRPIDVVYGYKYMGVCTREEAEAYANDPKKITKFHEGEMKIWDKDGNGIVDANDRVVQGHAAPTWMGSFSSNLAYKGIDFSFSIYTSQGGKVYSPFMAEFADYGQRGMQRVSMDFYIPEGAPILTSTGEIGRQETTKYGRYPYPTNGNNGKGGGIYWLGGSQNFVDNSFVRVKNITLGYTLPKAWVSKIKASNFRVYANVLNPFTFTKYKGFDPEWAGASVNDGSGGVSSRTYQVGVNLTF